MPARPPKRPQPPSSSSTKRQRITFSPSGTTPISPPASALPMRLLPTLNTTVPTADDEPTPAPSVSSVETPADSPDDSPFGTTVTKPTRPPNPNPNPNSESESDSDSDEAPEALSTSTARTTLLSHATRRGKALHTQHEVSRAERRAADGERKARAASKPSKRTPTPSSKSTHPSKNDVPALLPAEILNDTTTFQRAPTPPRQTRAKEPVRKEVRVNKITKFPQDIKDRSVKGVDVRVLREEKSKLAGRVKGRSRSARESWLAGRGRNMAVGAGSGRFLVR